MGLTFPVAARRWLEAGRGPAWTVLSQGLTSVANFLFSIIIVRSLGLAEFGQFSLCFLLMMLNRKFLLFSFLTPIGAIYPTISTPDLPRYRTFLLLYVAGYGLLVSGALWALAQPLGVLLNAEWLSAMALPLAVANFMATMADFLRRQCLEAGRPEAMFAVDFMRFVPQLAMLGYFGFFMPESFSAEVALWMLALGSLFGVLTGLVLSGPYTSELRGFGEYWRRHRRLTAWNGASTILDMMQDSIPMFIATAVLGAAALGTLRAMQQLANTLALPANVILQVTPGMAAKRFQAMGHAGLRKLLVRTTLVGIGLVVVLSLIVVALSDFVIGKAFRIDDPNALPIFLTFMAVQTASVIRLPIVVATNIVERPHLMTVAGAIGAVATVAGTALLLQRFGPVIVPAMTCLGVMLTALVNRIGLSRHMKEGEHLDSEQDREDDLLSSAVPNTKRI